jgi:hypothetical protein
MDNRKFEKLIDLIINENEEQARALFHDIVVEKSREIYESMMDDSMGDDMADEGKKFGGQVGQMMDEIGVEEEGMTEEEEELEFDDSDDDEDEMMDIDMDDEGSDEEESEELEDRVVDLEDKLDQLMAEFEEIMGSDEEGSDDESDAEFDDEAEEDGEDLTHDMEQDHDEEEAMMEAIQLQQMKGLYGSKIGGDNGSQPRSTYADNSGQAGMASRPVKFSGSTESMPTGPKGPSNAYAKGEGQVKDANNWKNAPAQRKQDLTAAPKPTTTQAAGTNTKSPVAESSRNKRK